MQTSVQILEWESQGLRCPDHKVSFTNRAGNVYPITLLQMPNGTGKTTTLELLRTALSGAAEGQWDLDKVRSLRKRGNSQGRGMFRVILSYTGQRLTITLKFDFEDGTLKYYTTTGSSGMREGFHPPRELRKFLRAEFVRFFVFNGELADHLLSREHTDAQTVIEDLFQLRIFGSLVNQVNEYWVTQTNGRGATEDRGLARRRNRVDMLRKRIRTLKAEKNKLEKEYKKTKDTLHEKETTFEAALLQQQELQEKLLNAENDYTVAKSDVRESCRAVLSRLRSPQNISASFAKQMISLKENLDRVKLPESTAREFFEELASEPHCVCGTELDDAKRQVIRERASQYLGSDDVTLLNSMKEDIRTLLGSDDEIHEAGLLEEVNRLNDNCLREQEARTTRDEVQNEGVANDPALVQVRNEINDLRERLAKLKSQLDKYEDMTDTAGDEDTYGIQVLEKRLEDAETKLAEITHTLTLKEKRDVLVKVLERAQEKARKGISSEICSDANKRIAQLMPNNAIKIEQIDRCLRLKDQEGGSAGENLSVGYAFLATLFNRTEHKLPFIVDSPANPIDLRVRTKVAELIPRLTGQFIAFTISSERQGFLPPLEKKAQNKLQYLTLFRKGATDLEQNARSSGHATETTDGFCVTGREFFNQFHLDSEVPNAV